MVERYIGIIKKKFKKIEHENKDPWLTLLEYRNTPLSNNIKSPNEIMFGRKTRCLLPFEKELENRLKTLQVEEKFIQKQINQENYLDKSTQVLKPLNVNENVFV